MLDKKITFKIISKVLKQQNFFHSQPSTLPKEALAKFYLSTTFGLSFMINYVAPTRSSTFYSYLITKIGNSSLKRVLKKLLLSARLTYKELLTVISEVEGKLNSQLLTYLDSLRRIFFLERDY